jgi:hypothetical protein
MELKNLATQNDTRVISVIGLSFGLIEKEAADFYLIEVIGDKDLPITLNHRMLLFKEHRLALQIGERLSRELSVKLDDERGFICDIRKALEIVSNADADTEGVVLNCINTLLDFVATSPFDLPDCYKILRSLADRLTFKEELGEFVQARGLLQNALLWCAGVTLSSAKIIESMEQFESVFPDLSLNPYRY